MKNSVKYFGIFVLVALLGAAKGETLEDLVKGKFVEHVGYCSLTATGKMTFKDSEAVEKVECVVALESVESPERWVIFYKRNKPNRLLWLHIKTMSQKILWSNPDSMV